VLTGLRKGLTIAMAEQGPAGHSATRPQRSKLLWLPKTRQAWLKC